jgi:2'-5' RNA ligase
VRVFAALEIPDGVLGQVAGWQEPLARRYPSLKWVSVENMHLTLRFFGDIDRDVLGRVLGIMGAWDPGPLVFRLETLGSFGRKASPSVYWLGGEFPAEVQHIARRLGGVPDDKGRVSTRGFVPHLTVARRRGGPLPLLEPPCPMTGTIRRAAVINSTLTSEGPVYEYIQAFDLH